MLLLFAPKTAFSLFFILYYGVMSLGRVTGHHYHILHTEHITQITVNIDVRTTDLNKA
jgi:hypothetical protein